MRQFLFVILAVFVLSGCSANTLTCAVNSDTIEVSTIKYVFNDVEITEIASDGVIITTVAQLEYINSSIASYGESPKEYLSKTEDSLKEQNKGYEVVCKWSNNSK